MLIKENASLKEYNTFNIDQTADIFIEIDNTNEILKFLENKNLTNNLFILGGGSNILFTRKYQGTILHIKEEGIRVIEEDEKNVLVEVASGTNWHYFVEWAIKHNYGGIENLSLIPGNVGAAPIQNIGAYGVELKDSFYSCLGVSLDNFEIKELKKSDCEFDYRSSIFKSKLKNRFIITSVKFILSKTNHNFVIEYKGLKDNLLNTKLSLEKISNEVIRIRKSKLPDFKIYGNCGSFFKNPIISIDHYNSLRDKYGEIPKFKIDNYNIKIPAAWLIDKCEFKNNSDKNVGVYKNQSLVIINFGNASGNEILNFAMKIKETVNKTFNIELEEEVIIL